jgi:integrase
MAIREVSRGKWRVDINLGHIHGKRARRVYYVYGTRRDAVRFERARLTERDQLRLPADGAATFRQLAEDFMTLRREEYSPTTTARYNSLLAVHLLPALGDRRLEKIAPREIERLYQSLARSGHRRRPGGLSPQTIRNVHVLLKSLFKYARRERFITHNPMNEISGPEAPKRPRQVVGRERLATLATALRRSRYRVPVMLALATGLRRGELLGLRWGDVDLEHGTLTVRQTVVEGEHGVLHVKPPKSHTSSRTIALAPSTVALLREHQRAQRERMLRTGLKHWHDHDLVCAARNGDYIRPSRLTTAYRGLAGRHGLSGVSLHDLRHTHATFLLDAGVDLKTISARLGHSSIALTADTYAHVTEQLDREAAARLERYLNGEIAREATH